MKMEILLEPTSNKLMIQYCKLEILSRRFILPDHRKLKDGGEDFRYSDTECLSRSDEVLKLKNFKKDATLKLFKSTNQERILTGLFRIDNWTELRKRFMDRYQNDVYKNKGYQNDDHRLTLGSLLKRLLELALKSGKLNHVVKDVRQKGREIEGEMVPKTKVNLHGQKSTRRPKERVTVNQRSGRMVEGRHSQTGNIRHWNRKDAEKRHNKENTTKTEL
ncbi:hypothetical protein Tco_1576387 [Tanacetum coccineum]